MLKNLGQCVPSPPGGSGNLFVEFAGAPIGQGEVRIALLVFRPAHARLVEARARMALADNDGWGFFAGLPEAIVTGPTGTNVADLAFVLAAGRPRAFFAASVQPAYSVPLTRASEWGAGDKRHRYTGER